MSRLWINTWSDLRKGTGKGANINARCSVHWGSAGDSKNAASISVYWPKDDEFPSVTITVGESENPLPPNQIHFKKHEIEVHPGDRELRADAQC